MFEKIENNLIVSEKRKARDLRKLNKSLKDSIKKELKIDNTLLNSVCSVLGYNQNEITSDNEKKEIISYYDKKIKNQYLTFNELAKKTGYSTAALGRLCLNGVLQKTIRFSNNRVLVHISEVDKITATEQKTSKVFKSKALKAHKMEVKEVADILISQNLGFKNLGQKLLDSIEKLESFGG